jgi:glutamine synthetase
MHPDAPAELAAHLRDHPETRFFDAFLSDLNTVERGKRIDVAAMPALCSSGMLLPGSMFALDVEGGTVQQTGLGFDEGDADRPCRPVAGSFVPVPWQSSAIAQVQLSMFEHDGRAFFGDPRHVLARVLERFGRLNLTPVVAIEYEFYLVDLERTPAGQPQPPRLPLRGRREFRTQVNSMADLEEYSPLLERIDAYCRVQRVPTTSALCEYGPGQFEVNLRHRADALAACDEALRFKRIVKSAAREQGCEATFLAKPYREMAGSGLHVHASVLDAAGHNIFECDEPAQCADLRHAVAGVVDSLADGVAICAPGPNSYRRFRPDAYVPLQAQWSVNNRGAAVRIPVGDAANRRIEHRLAGADANPYLVVAWLLAGIHAGLARGAEPPAPLAGNAYARPARDDADGGSRALPLHWPLALERFAASGFAGEYLGKPFRDLYATVKRSELDEFAGHVTPLEIERFLGPI